MTAFNDPEIISLLSEKTVPVATDVRDTKRQDADGEFFRKVTKPISYRQSGACVFTPDGRVLGQCSATSRKEVYDLLKSALPKFQPPAEPPKIEPLGKLDDKNRYVVEPPEGSLVVNTMMTHLSEHGRGTHPWFDKLLPETVAVDRLWILKEEQQALAAGTFPESLTKRLARWHFVDSITFDQNRAGTVKSIEVELDNGRITGSMHLDGSTQKMKLNLLGFVQSQNGAVNASTSLRAECEWVRTVQSTQLLMPSVLPTKNTSPSTCRRIPCWDTAPACFSTIETIRGVVSHSNFRLCDRRTEGIMGVATLARVGNQSRSSQWDLASILFAKANLSVSQ